MKDRLLDRASHHEMIAHRFLNDGMRSLAFGHLRDAEAKFRYATKRFAAAEKHRIKARGL